MTYIEINSEQAHVLNLPERQHVLQASGYGVERNDDGEIIGLIDPYDNLERRFFLFGFTATSPEETAAMSEHAL